MLKQSLLFSFLGFTLLFSACSTEQSAGRADYESLSVQIQNESQVDVRMEFYMDGVPVFETKHIDPTEEGALGEYFILFAPSKDTVLTVESTLLLPGDQENVLFTEDYDLSEALESTGGLIVTQTDEDIGFTVVREFAE